MLRIAVVEAPSILGLRPTGVDTLPAALLGVGLLDRLHAAHAGRIVPDTPYEAVPDPATLTLNASGIAAFSSKLERFLRRARNRGSPRFILPRAKATWTPRERSLPRALM